MRPVRLEIDEGDHSTELPDFSISVASRDCMREIFISVNVWISVHRISIKQKREE